MDAASEACRRTGGPNDVEGLRRYIRDVPDFPKKGIVFKDITPLLLAPGALRRAARALIEPFGNEPIDLIAGIESRGFVIAAAAALERGLGLALVRKKGKLPYKTVAATYQLEYGADSVEMHIDAVQPGQNVLVIDDLIATGGTALATCKLVEELKGRVVGCGFIIELAFLAGREKLRGFPVVSLIRYDTP